MQKLVPKCWDLWWVPLAGMKQSESISFFSLKYEYQNLAQYIRPPQKHNHLKIPIDHYNQYWPVMTSIDHFREYWPGPL